MFWTKLVSLCNEKNISPNKVCLDLGFSNSLATKWKNGASPRSTTLKKVADYFGLQVEFFSDNEMISHKEKPYDDGELDEVKMRKLYAAYCALSPERQRQFDDYLDFLLSQQGE